MPQKPNRVPWMHENPRSAVGNPTSALGSSGSSFGPSGLAPTGIHRLLLSKLTTDCTWKCYSHCKLFWYLFSNKGVFTPVRHYVWWTAQCDFVIFPRTKSRKHQRRRRSSSSSFYLPNNTTVCTSTSIQSRRAGQQGPTRTLTVALKRVIKQLLGTYSTTLVKYYRQTRKLQKSIFSMLFLKIPKGVKFTADGRAFQTFISSAATAPLNVWHKTLSDSGERLTFWLPNLIDWLCVLLLAILYDHMIMYASLFGHSAVVFHVLLCFTDICVVVYFSVTFYWSIRRYICQSV